MRLMEAELISKRSTKFQQSCINKSVPTVDEPECSENCIGGIIKRGQLGWIAQGSLLETHSLRNGQKISSFRFDYNLGFEHCVITCVSEIDPPGINCCILAVGVLFSDSAGGIVALYSVKESKVLRCIEVKEKVTSCQFIASEISKRTILHMMQGCIAIGTDTGKIFLLDINLSKCEEALFSTRRSEADIELVPCHIVSSSLEFTHIRQHHKHSRQENINFGIELERVDNAGIVLSMLSLTPLLTLAVGLEDGRMVLYDLSELQPFHIAYPPERLSPLVKMAFLEPPDDPRACVYVWAYHENPQMPIAVMHSIMYDKKIQEDDGICLFEGFQCCNVRLTLPMYDRGSLPVTCRAITKLPTQDDEEVLAICLLSWRSRKFSHIMIFDINQWYKEEMPNVGDWRDGLNYLAHFQLQDCSALDTYIDPATIASFNSIQRPEEHFYPISLCFDCTMMQPTGSVHLHWPGLQNRALDMLRTGGPTAILEPTSYFNEVMRASLLPQFSEYNYNSTLSINAQREILLSIALEYNCFGLLKECAKCWADGSYLGRQPFEGLSLSTLTEWIWNRAKNIKNRCNALCVPLFDHSGIRIDQRSQKELSHLCRQLKLLSDLYELILTRCKEYIPNSELGPLTNQCDSIRMAGDYQEVLQWLLNIGLLPEGVNSSDDDKTYQDKPLVPYPYKILKSYYMNQRMRFGKLNKGFISSRTQSCRILYIDSFIEHECNANVLRDYWQESGGNGLYPPPSLQAMLRTLLLPDVSIENKYILFIYLFLDLNMAIEDESYAPIVQNLIKFPAVFKLNASLIKIVQAFWNLDHGQFEVALDEIISPFSQDRKLSQWQQELLIEALLSQDQPNLALQALQARASPVSSLLELKTLLANDLVAEAYHLQRSKNDPELLRTFLNGCLYLGKWGVLRDLALTEEEGKTVEEFLREAKSSKAENLHFVYLLQRSKYVEAISYLDELSKSKQTQRAVDLETPNLVLSAYNLTMTPATKQVSDVYCNIRNRIKPKDATTSTPMPLSCELLRNGVKDLAGGIYHSSALSTDQATMYWDEGLQKETNRLLDANNVPFIRQPQLDVGDFIARESLSYPEVFKGVAKRRLNDSSDAGAEDPESVENPKKKRRVLYGSENVLQNRKSIRAINTTLLTRFKDKSVKNQSLSDKSLNISYSRQNSGERNAQLLSTPIVKSCRIDFKDDLDTVDSNYERVCTPHSILKVKNIMRPLSLSPSIKTQDEKSMQSKSVERSVSKQAETIEEEKSIRFELPRRSDITNSSMSFDESSKITLSETVPSLGGPSKRKPIRSADTSLVTISDTDEFFSPVRSRDISKIEERMDTESEDETSAVRTKEVQEEEDDEKNEVMNDERNEVINDEKDEVMEREKDEAMDDSKQEVLDDDKQDCMDNDNIKVAHSEESSNLESTEKNEPQETFENIYTEKSPLKRYKNHNAGPKARPPLRRSKTPSKPQSNMFLSDQTTSLNVSERRTRSRSRSKTPDIPLSPSRRSSRLVEKSVEPRKPLSRMVLEANAKKTVSTALETTATNIQKTSTKVQEIAKEHRIEITEVFTVDTSNFQPRASSSKILRFPSKFGDMYSRDEDISALEYETAMDEALAQDVCSETIASLMAPKQIIPDDSITSDSFSQNWRDGGGDLALMTTVDMTSFGSDVTFGALEPPGNLLSDSDSGDSTKNKESVNKDTIDEKENRREIVCQEGSEEIKDEAQLNEKLDNVEESKESHNVEAENIEEQKYVKIVIADVRTQTDDEIKKSLEENPTSVKESPENEYEEIEISGGNSEDDVEIVSEERLVQYSEESCDEDGSDIVINISSSDDASQSEENVSKPERENKTDSCGVSSTKEISDFLYRDIDQQSSSTSFELDVNSDNDDLNDAVILGNTSLGDKTDRSEQSKCSPSTSIIQEDKKSKIDESKEGNENEGSLNKQEGNLDKFKDTFELEPPVMTIEKGVTINFLTGEEEQAEETGEYFTITELNEGRLEDTSVAVTESEISCIETDVSDYKSVAEDRTISSISAMDVDDEPYEFSKNPLNEQILDDTIKSSKVSVSSSDTSKIEKLSSADELKTPKCEQDNSRKINIPLLIVSPPEESDNVRAEIIAKKSEQQTEDSIKIKKDTAEPTTSKYAGDDIITSSEAVAKISASTEEIKKSAPTKPVSEEPNVSIHINRGSPEFDKTTGAAESTVLEIDIKIDDKIAVGSENKKTKTTSESPLKRKTPDRSILDVESTTPSSSRTLRSRRARSESIDIEPNSPSLQRITRATSVPRTDLNTTPKQRKLRKLSESSNTASPNRVLTRRQSQLLERIEEGSILDSPSARTRTQKRLNSNDSEPDTSSPTMMKQSRRNSYSSAGTPDLMSTPRRVRGKSVLSDENAQSTPRRNRSSFSKEKIVLEDSPKLEKYQANTDSEESSEESSKESSPTERNETTKTSVKSKTSAKPGKKRTSSKDQENTSTYLERQEKVKLPKTKKTTRSVSSKNLNETDSTESEMSDSDEVISHKSSVASKRSSKSVKTVSSGKIGLRARKELEDIHAGGDAHNASILEDLSSSRRVTRNQLAIIEKGLSSPALAPEPKKIARRRVSKTEGSPVKRSDRDSEVESVASGKSKMSTDSKRRATRSSAKEDADETSSIASSTRSRASNKSKREQPQSKPKDKNLKPILEDLEDDTNESSDESMEPSHKEVPKKRGRAKKSSK